MEKVVEARVTRAKLFLRNTSNYSRLAKLSREVRKSDFQALTNFCNACNLYLGIYTFSESFVPFYNTIFQLIFQSLTM